MRASSRAFARLSVVSLATACAFAASCKSSKEPAPGQLMVSIQTDMEIPKDINKIEVECTVYGNRIFYNPYDLGPYGLRIPATLGIVAGKDPATPVKIRVTAQQAGTVRMLKEVVTTVPQDRVALLRVPIQWLCDGQFKQTGDNVYESTCPLGQSCEAGSCVSYTVDSAKLDTYSPDLVYGGASGPGLDGACLDTVPCFSKGAMVPFDPSDCSFAAPSGGLGVNVALVNQAGSDGICGPYACLIPFDEEPDWGFRQEAGRIKLPMEACKRVQQGKSEGIAVTTACETKKPSIPTCGPWSSVETAGNFDAGAPEPVTESGAGGAAGDASADQSTGGAAGDGGAGLGGSGGSPDGSTPADAQPDGSAGPFSCVGNLSWPAPGQPTYALQLWFQNAASSANMPGLSVKACPKSDGACAAPTTSGTTDSGGFVTLTVPSLAEGIDAYFEVIGTSIPTTLVYLAFADPTIFAQPQPQFILPIVDSATLLTLASDAGATVTAGKGHVTFTARDCTNKVVSGVKVAAPSGVVFYSNGSTLSTSMTETGMTGQGMIFNVTPGAAMQTGIAGSINGGSTSLGTIPVWIRADAITSINVVPWK